MSKEQVSQKAVEVEVLEGVIVPQNEKEITKEDVIRMEVAKFDTTTSKLKSIVSDYSELIKEPISDVETYNKVYAAHQDIKSINAKVKSKSKELKSNFEDIKKGITNHENELLLITANIEKDLEASRKVWEQAEEARKNAEKIAKKEALDKRVQQVKDAGALFDGEMYVCGSVSVSVMDIRDLTEKRFEALLTSITEQSELLKRLQEEEAERQRLAEQQAEKERQEAEEKRLQQEAENKKMKEQLLSMRLMMLSAHGLQEKNGVYFYKQTEITRYKALEEMNDADFMNFNAGLVNRKAEIDENQRIGRLIEERRKALSFINGVEETRDGHIYRNLTFDKPTMLLRSSEIGSDIDFEIVLQETNNIIAKDKERNKTRENNIGLMQDLGFVFDGIQKRFVFINNIEELSYSEEEVTNNYEEISYETIYFIENKIAEIKTKTNEAILKQQKEAEALELAKKKKAEQERQNSLSDEQKYNEYIAKLKDVEVPTFATEDFINRVKSITNFLNK